MSGSPLAASAEREQGNRRGGDTAILARIRRRSSIGPVAYAGLSNCLDCDLNVGGNGYPKIKIGGRNGRKITVSRVVLAIKLGRDIAPGMLACHTCDRSCCVNPDHLYEGTVAQNNHDAVTRGRRERPFRGSTNPHARLTDTDVIAIRGHLARGESRRVVARDYGLAIATIRDIHNRTRWTHLAGTADAT